MVLVDQLESVAEKLDQCQDQPLETLGSLFEDMMEPAFNDRCWQIRSSIRSTHPVRKRLFNSRDAPPELPLPAVPVRYIHSCLLSASNWPTNLE